MKNEETLYRKLRKHLDAMPIGMPETNSGVEISLLKKIFPPDEAEIVLELSMVPEPVKKIHKRLKGKGHTEDKLREKLQDMVKRGLILREWKKDQWRYSRVHIAIGFYEFQVNRMTREMVEDIHRYEKEGFAEELHRTKIPQMRTIPVEVSLEHQTGVHTHDELRRIIDRAGDNIAVANCICRQGKDMIGESCKHTDLRESCFMLNSAADHYLHMGLARRITREEAMTILEKVQGDGLVLHPGNNLNSNFICTCCGDCCGYLNTMKQFPRPAELSSSTCQARVNEAECTACGVCMDWCPMDAIELKGAARVNLDRCIGCGNCVPRCGFGAMELFPREKQKPLAKNSGEMYLKILAKKNGPWKMLKLGVNLALGRKV